MCSSGRRLYITFVIKGPIMVEVREKTMRVAGAVEPMALLMMLELWPWPRWRGPTPPPRTQAAY